jgi:predicted DNA-binding transcriptional regulator AlpA
MSNVTPLRAPLPPRAVGWSNVEIIQWQKERLVAAGADPGMIRDDEPFRFLRLPEVEQRSGLRRSSIYRKVQEGSFPAPIVLGGTAAPSSAA